MPGIALHFQRDSQPFGGNPDQTVFQLRYAACFAAPGNLPDTDVVLIRRQPLNFIFKGIEQRNGVAVMAKPAYACAGAIVTQRVQRPGIDVGEEPVLEVFVLADITFCHSLDLSEIGDISPPSLWLSILTIATLDESGLFAAPTTLDGAISGS